MGRKAFGGKPAITMSAQDFLRSLLSSEVGLLLKFDPVARKGRDPEGVHQLRVGARRLRAELKVIAPAIRAAPLRRLERELRWVGRVLGEQRDLDVLSELLHSVTHELSPSLRTSILRDVRTQQKRMNGRVADLLASERYRRLIGTLTDAVIHPPLRSSANKPAIDLVRPNLSATLCDLFDSVDALGDSPSNDQLHRIRILAKRGRYSAEIAAPLIGESAGGVGAALEKVQTVLGELHDCCVATAFLEERLSFADAPCEEPEAGGSIAVATQRLAASIEELRARWREPLEQARVLSAPLVSRGSLESKGPGVQHEVE